MSKCRQTVKGQSGNDAAQGHIVKYPDSLWRGCVCVGGGGGEGGCFILNRRMGLIPRYFYMFSNLIKFSQSS